MKYLTIILAQFKQWILSIVMWRCLLGHKLTEWHDQEYQHEDWYYYSRCDKCGKLVIRTEKPKNKIIISHPPNAT
jgi:hypothetical protein